VERRLREWQGTIALGESFQSFCQKLDGLWGRLTLVLGYVIQTDTPDTIHVVEREAAEVAETLIFDHLLQSAARFYEWMGGGGDAELTKQIAGFILAKSKARLIPSDLTNNVRECRGMKIDEIQKALSALVAMDWLIPDAGYNSRSWDVNPLVHEQFRERRAVEVRERGRIRELIQQSVARQRGDGEKGDIVASDTDSLPQFYDKYDCRKEVQSDPFYDEGHIPPRPPNQDCHNDLGQKGGHAPNHNCHTGGSNGVDDSSSPVSSGSEGPKKKLFRAVFGEQWKDPEYRQRRQAEFARRAAEE
jgi:hypothetical protein